MNADTVSMPPIISRPSPGGGDGERRDVTAGSWTERLLAAVPATTWAREGRRLAAALGFAAVFGAVLGLRQGGLTIALSAAGVCAGMLAVSAVAVPAFAIVLALASAPIDAIALAQATTRATAKAGLVLGGLAPAVALYVVTVEDGLTVTLIGFGALLLAGLIAMRSFAMDLFAQIDAGPAGGRWMIRAAMLGFLVFASVLAVRVWWIALPSLTGAQ